MQPQNSDFAYFESHRDEFVKTHPDQFVVIKDGQVLGFYETQMEALQTTVSVHPLGTFIVQKCITRDQDIARFHSRVSFA